MVRESRASQNVTITTMFDKLGFNEIVEDDFLGYFHT